MVYHMFFLNNKPITLRWWLYPFSSTEDYMDTSKSLKSFCFTPFGMGSKLIRIFVYVKYQNFGARCSDNEFCIGKGYVGA